MLLSLEVNLNNIEFWDHVLFYKVCEEVFHIFWKDQYGFSYSDMAEREN